MESMWLIDKWSVFVRLSGGHTHNYTTQCRGKTFYVFTFVIFMAAVHHQLFKMFIGRDWCGSWNTVGIVFLMTGINGDSSSKPWRSQGG